MLDGQELLTKGRIAAEYAVRRRTLPEHCENARVREAELLSVRDGA
jgi:hypothetical protein